MNDTTSHQTPMTIQEVQSCVLEIMVEVIRLCERFQIEYCLIGGGCLGIARHNKSFVPWDDDLDIAIFAEDMERFVESMKLLPKQYKIIIQNPISGSICKIHDSRTLIVNNFENANHEKIGVFVDVIPMMVWTSRWCMLVGKCFFNLCVDRHSQSPVFWKQIAKYFINKIQLRKLTAPIYNNLIAPTLFRISIYLRNSESGIVSGSIGLIWKGKYPWHVIFPLQKAELDGVKINVPNDLCEFLRLRYGENYMTIPELDERWNHFDQAYRLSD